MPVLAFFNCIETLVTLPVCAGTEVSMHPQLLIILFLFFLEGGGVILDPKITLIFLVYFVGYLSFFFGGEMPDNFQDKVGAGGRPLSRKTQKIHPNLWCPHISFEPS